MKLTIAAILACSAAAFAPETSTSRVNSRLSETKADLEALAVASNPVLKYYDPLELSSISIWGESNEASINFLRHSEIKHGRIAMAAFVGYIVQSNGIRFPWSISLDGTPFPAANNSPPEQWDALPYAAKWQIILFIGFLEWYSEAAGTHYMRGGAPGAYPKLTENELVPHPLPFDLFDPFGFSANKSEEQKAAGRVKEINNGRLAMIGILGFISEQRVEGSVPLVKGLVSHYSGETMAPF